MEGCSYILVLSYCFSPATNFEVTTCKYNGKYLPPFLAPPAPTNDSQVLLQQVYYNYYYYLQCTSIQVLLILRYLTECTTDSKISSVLLLGVG